MSEVFNSDIQARLAFIETEAKQVRRDEMPPSEDKVKHLAYLVEYLAAIVRKHLQTGEQ